MAAPDPSMIAFSRQNGHAGPPAVYETACQSPGQSEGGVSWDRRLPVTYTRPPAQFMILQQSHHEIVAIYRSL
jgi:hypothetical protein